MIFCSMKSKNKEIFETLYEQYSKMVLQMCLGFVKGDKDIANDLLQEIFINVWSSLDKFKGVSSYKTWIYRITVNTCLQYINKTKKEKTFSISENEDKIPINEPVDKSNPDIQKLYKAIGQLKKIDRLIIMMVLENQDYENIAEIIGVNSINLRVKIHRIKARLKNILKSIDNE